MLIMHLFTFWATSITLSCFCDLALSKAVEDDTLHRDVVVIGGGASGTYTAVRLKDENKTVAVIEKKSTLGGHAETYVDPHTGYTIDIGVRLFNHLKVVTDYFARFDVPLTILSSTVQPEYIDFSTGQNVTYTAPGPEALGAALAAYQTQLEKYPDLQKGFNMTYPVEPDLLLNFGEFVTKYGLEALVPQIFITNQGYAPLLNISTLYMFKYFNAAQVSSFSAGYLTTVSHNMQELYQKATTFLGDDVLLDSAVLSMNRTDPGAGPVQILVQTPTGQKLIVAKKVVSTIPPLLDNLGGYDLASDETALFAQFSSNGYYTGLLNNTGLNFVAYNSDSRRPYNVPELPGLYLMQDNQGLTQVYYASPTVLPDDEVKADILAIVRRVQEARGVVVGADVDVKGTPEWLAFSSHAPFNLEVSNNAVSDGFYKKLFELQGKRNTFWNGAAWHTQDSTALWQFTEDYVLPMILASL
ncbi:FAD/NAD(P)-binding domain-containing protein [Hypoxylon fragiforme]|uniref:FAD/NAD(P)-binding domain-containing protein n=1 Tax=Hypoxylon fragiforme TaxID=63214 RepID=UPI0020C62D11|nr:FAD/NAD(P)-binding domain-containing protein [Hypoxylon fragiforme]KAI2605763.1 FAD/NAD(P)-binding domain-containing protein [Hypoxylon fragiforme]